MEEGERTCELGSKSGLRTLIDHEVGKSLSEMRRSVRLAAKERKGAM